MIQRIPPVLALLAALLGVSACSQDDTMDATEGATPVAGLALDAGAVTVSGISSGAHMAQQLHFARSDLFHGAGLIAGGPWACGQGGVSTAFARCMAEAPDVMPVDEFVASLRTAETEGRVAPLTALADDRVWMFHGTKDAVIAPEVHAAAASVYEAFLEEGQISQRNDVPAAHLFPTLDAGNGCDQAKAPFLGACGIDAAGDLLAWLNPDRAEQGPGAPGELLAVTLPGADDAGLLEQAWLYVPASCKDGVQRCGLHLALHGCAMSTDKIGMAFVEEAGYQAAADRLGLVVAFPQVEGSLMNPLGCWDWWGYTGDDFLDQDGAQPGALSHWVESLLGMNGAAASP